MKAIIIDDEQLARQLIREYLKDFPEIEVVAECQNGKQAIKAINEKKPDLIFLDIRMPGLDGFEVLEHLEVIPRIIFSTAYGDYALKAFEVNAVDYLLKPYDRERFSKAVNRVLKTPMPNTAELNRLINALHESVNTDKYPSRFFVRLGRRIYAINVDDILWIEAQGDYSNLYTKNGAFLCNMNLGQLEKKLDPKYFIRVHRSFIVANNAIDRLMSDGEGGYILFLKDNSKVRVSRTYAKKIRQFIW